MDHVLRFTEGFRDYIKEGSEDLDEEIKERMSSRPDLNAIYEYLIEGKESVGRVSDSAMDCFVRIWTIQADAWLDTIEKELNRRIWHVDDPLYWDMVWWATEWPDTPMFERTDKEMNDGA